MKVERLNLLGKVKGIISNSEFYKKPSCRGNWSMLPWILHPYYCSNSMCITTWLQPKNFAKALQEELHSLDFFVLNVTNPTKTQGQRCKFFYIHLPEAQQPLTPTKSPWPPGPGGWDTYGKFWNDKDATLPQSHPQSAPRSPLVWRHLRTRSAHGDGSHSPAIQRWGSY